jgi:hypothetical protein
MAKSGTVDIGILAKSTKSGLVAGIAEWIALLVVDVAVELGTEVVEAVAAVAVAVFPAVLVGGVVPFKESVAPEYAEVLFALS